MSEQHIQNMIDGEIEKVAEAITNLRAIGGERAVGEALKMAGLPPNGAANALCIARVSRCLGPAKW